MNIQSIAIENFKSFKDSHFSFIHRVSPSGLFYVTGDNQVEPELGPNGCGKSAMMEAICWCLFGKTSTNLIASNIINWGNKSCRVTLQFDNKTLVRTQSPNSLILDGKSITQEVLESIIGLNFKSFLYSVFISQFSAKFFDLDPADKLDIFSEIMEDLVSKWEKRSEWASNLETEFHTKLKEDEGRASFLEGTIKTMEYDNISALIDKWDMEHETRLSSLVDKATDIENYITTGEGTLEDKIKTVDKLKVELAELSDVFEKRQDDYDKVTENLKAIEKESIESGIELNIIDKDIENFTNLGSVCSQCKQEVDRGYADKQLEILNVQRKVKARKCAKIDTALNKILNEHKIAREELTGLQEMRNKTKSQIDSLSMAIKSISDTIIDRKKTLSELIREISEEENKVNPNLQVQQDNKDRLKVLRRKHDAVLSNMRIEKELIDNYGLWAKAYKDIRLSVIESALMNLEMMINNHLVKFGMAGWEVNLRVDSFTKKGTIKRGFHVLVISPDKSNEAVPFSVWSGGEGQRLRLAGTLGLIDFIHAQRGTDWDIEIFDEPTQFLSEEGIKTLLDTLYERANTLNKKIFIIDHRQFEKLGYFSGIISITKDNGGSKIDYYEV